MDPITALAIANLALSAYREWKAGRVERGEWTPEDEAKYAAEYRKALGEEHWKPSGQQAALK